MELAPVDRGLVVVYLIAVLAVGLSYRRRERTSEGWFLAGRTLTLPAFVATLVATWYGGILGVGEYAHQYGLAMLSTLAFPYYVFALAFALFLAPRIREAELYTIPDKVADAYGKGAGLVAAIYAYGLTNPAPYVLMLGVLLHLVFGLALLPAMVVGVVLSTVYVYTGGFTADVRLNILQFGLMFLGFAIIVPAAWSSLGSPSWLAGQLPPLHLTFHGGQPPQYLLVWFFIALLTMVDPGFHQRCYAAESPRTARDGVLVSILFWMLFDAMTVTAGLYSRAALPNLPADQATMAYPLLAEQVLPPFLRGLFVVGMLATVMSTLVSFTFLCGVTFARDLVWRVRGGDPDEGVAVSTAVGLVLTSALAIGLAAWYESVVDLWWLIGTAFVPGLLLPLLTAYAPRARIAPALATVAMVAATATSLGWVVWGQTHLVDGWPAYPLGLEPMYPGLALSLGLFALGWLVGRREAA